MSQVSRRSSGFTLVEQLIGLTVVTTVLTGVIPGFRELRERHRLDSAAAAVETELQWARGMAVARQQDVRVRFGDPADGCYTIHVGPLDGCRCAGDGTAACTPGAELIRSATLSAADGIAVDSTARSISFNGDWGTVTPTASIELRNRLGQRVRVVINIAGRARSCAPGPAMPGLPPC